MPFALPPLAEQRRIVAKVDELMALVDALEAQLAVSRTTATKLLEALVAELTAASSWGVEEKPVDRDTSAEEAPLDSRSNGHPRPSKSKRPAHAR